MAEAQTVDNATIIADETQTAIKALATGLDTTSDHLLKVNLSLQKIAHMLTTVLGQDDFFETYQVTAGLPWTLDKHGRRWTLVFTPVALATIAINLQGVTGTITIPAGWSALNEPDRTVFVPPSGMSQLIGIKYTNWWSGSAT